MPNENSSDNEWDEFFRTRKIDISVPVEKDDTPVSWTKGLAILAVIVVLILLYFSR